MLSKTLRIFLILLQKNTLKYDQTVS